ncbi:MAG: ribosome biogenesis GTP-binding protein YihA/YsxC [SAR324 cluster bacterium]|nr:ribosome biogenesis GTP-binding protein YihA/YsxC [SAR324 cluster bacterium]
MKIVSAEFLISAVSPEQFPPPYVPEIAFLGKSNVGKSSLINVLLNRKHLVKTSGTPGKTRAINFFLINGRFRFVDLPGYGFAKVSQAERRAWQGLSESYLTAREALRGVVMIVDARHPGSPLDAEMKTWLDHLGVPALLVANKADKLGKSQIAKQLKAFAAELSPTTKPIAKPIACSAKTRLGRDEIWSQLTAWLGQRG